MVGQSVPLSWHWESAHLVGCQCPGSSPPAWWRAAATEPDLPSWCPPCSLLLSVEVQPARIEQFQHKSGLLSSSVFSHCNGQSLQTALGAFLFHHISIFILLIRCPLEYCDNHVCSILQLSEEARTRHITRPHIW